MEQSKIDRINQLALKARQSTLTEAEKEEQKLLRQEYIKAFRGNLKTQLDSIVLVDKDGNKKYLRKNN
ncbi:MAG: DUF896 domain-containing protein [Bacillota bacterium]|nr:DUF896 domain-containing protein [Bacillota bacterium]